uniref:Uncharacterized protein n=1 Tax=Fusarium oxysporum (strain Fo5176) TaxID=660025 RepID=A0A0D2XAS6_FUSOF
MNLSNRYRSGITIFLLQFSLKTINFQKRNLHLLFKAGHPFGKSIRFALSFITCCTALKMILSFLRRISLRSKNSISAPE